MLKKEKISKKETEKDQLSPAGLPSSGSRADEMLNRKSSLGPVITRNVVGIFFIVDSDKV